MVRRLQYHILKICLHVTRNTTERLFDLQVAFSTARSERPSERSDMYESRGLCFLCSLSK